MKDLYSINSYFGMQENGSSTTQTPPVTQQPTPQPSFGTEVPKPPKPLTYIRGTILISAIVVIIALVAASAVVLNMSNTPPNASTSTSTIPNNNNYVNNSVTGPTTTISGSSGSKFKEVTSCMTIDKPGTSSDLGWYRLSQDINAQSQNPCIKIVASNINFSCGGHTISNATAAIQVSSVADNVQITQCTIRNAVAGIAFNGGSLQKVTNVSVYGSIYGIDLAGTSSSGLRNVNVYNNTYGVYLLDAYFTNMGTATPHTADTGIRALNNIYGLYISGSNVTAVSDSTFNNNTYGIYITNSMGTGMMNMTALGNTKTDVYATADSAYNFSKRVNNNQILFSVCGTTDLQTLPSYPPYSSCETIVSP